MNMRLASIMLVWGHLLIPGYFVYRFVDASYHSLGELLLSAGVLLSFCGLMVLIGRWDWFGVWLRYLLILVPASIVLLDIWNLRQLPWLAEDIRWIDVGINAILLITFAFLAGRAYAGRKHHEPQQLDAGFPFANGTFYVAHGGSDSLVNYHVGHGTQKYALDIVKLGANGTRALGFYPSQLDRYVIFEEPVLSPVNGTVLAAVDGWPDLRPPQLDINQRAGNYLVLKPDERPDLYILMAHLRRGSIKVQPGDVVRQGRTLATIGNSGNTTEPHLHIHCATIEGADSGETIGDFTSSGIGVPLLMEGRFLVRNNIVRSKKSEIVENMQFATSTA